MRISRRYGWILALPSAVLVLVFLVTPLVYFLLYSLEADTGGRTVSLHNFIRFFESGYYRNTLGGTFLIALGSTIATFIAALPVAYFMSKSSGRAKTLMIIGTVFPLLVGSVVRSIGWVALLAYSGPLNSALTGLGLTSEPIEFLNSPITVAVAISSVTLPVMVLVLHASLALVDPTTERAGLSLGASPVKVFLEVTLPQITPGVVTATTLVFIMSLNAYATPVLVGGSQVPMLAPEIYSAITRFNDWPLAAAIALIALGISLTVIILYGRVLRHRFERWRSDHA